MKPATKQPIKPLTNQLKPKVYHAVVAGIFTLSVQFPSAQAVSFNDVVDVVFSKAQLSSKDSDRVKQEKQIYLDNKLPQYQVSYDSVFNKHPDLLKKRAKATLDDEVDYYPRLDKLVHSNGVCMAGTWHITKSANKNYTGMFAKGARSLFVGRLSVALSETKADKPRAFGMAGKLLGTMNADQEVISQNFFVADVLSGTQRNSLYDAPMTNAPKFDFRFGIVRMGIKLARIFSKADKDASTRPVVHLAKLGASENQTVTSPKYMMLMPIKPKTTASISSAGVPADFREEFLLTEHEKQAGVERNFAIYVSDTAKRAEDKGWQHIGFIKADKTVVSYGCDRQLHFAHPRVGKTSE